MLVEVTFVRDARSVTQVTPETPIAADNVVAGAFIRNPRASFSGGVGGGAGGGATTFLGLADTPDSYAGKANYLVTVNATEDALLFTPPSGAGFTIPYNSAYSVIARVDPGGDDATGVAGDFGLPFQTVAAAIAALEALPGVAMRYIDVGATFFSETITTSLSALGIIGRDNENSGVNSITFTDTTSSMLVTMVSAYTNNLIFNTTANVEIDPLGGSYVGSVTATSATLGVVIGGGAFIGGQCGDVTTGGCFIQVAGLCWVGELDAAGGDIRIYNCIPGAVDYTTFAGVPLINSVGSDVWVNFGLVTITHCANLTLNDARTTGGTSGATGTVTYNDVFLSPATPFSFIDSIVESGGDVSLQNDAPTPGANKHYGTNGAGVRGWISDPSIPGVPNFIDSVVESGGNVSLENDQATPGANKQYDTDGAGVRGWHAKPTIPTVPTFIDSVVDVSNQVSLDGDAASPGVSMLYGTDGLGVRGWQPQPVVSAAVGNYLVSGGGAAWTGTALNYQVSAAVYVIGGVQYSSPQSTITLNAADPSQDRIDVIAVDTTGAVVKITGTPGGPPILPAVDPATQLQLTFVYVPAGATTPPVTNENIYLENTEWTSSVSAGTINAASTNNPYAGTKDIEGTAVANGQYVNLANPGSPIKVSDYTNLVLQIRSKAAWPNQKAMSIYWGVGTAVTLKNGTFGFNSSNTTGYQQIVIPASSFNTGTSLASFLRLTVTGGGGNIGWYVDNIVLQGAAGGAPPPGGGDFSTNTNVSLPDEMVLFADTTGKVGKRGPSVKAATQGNFYFTSKRVSGLQTGKITGYWTCPYAGNITGWNLSVDAGTLTIKIWKKATGTVSPTSADSITPTGLSLSTGTAIRSTTLTGFSTLAVAIGDIFAVEITAVSGAVDMGGSIEITKT